MRIIGTLFCTLYLSLTSGLLGIQPAAVDKDRAAREIEIMKSIIATTLSFVQKDSAEELSGLVEEFEVYGDSGHYKDQIEGFYLYEQGTLMRISLPRLPVDGSRQLAALEKKLRKVKQGLGKDLPYVDVQLHLVEHELSMVYENLQEYSEAMEMAAQLADYTAQLEEADSPEKRQEYEKQLQQRIEKYEQELIAQRKRMKEVAEKTGRFRSKVKQALVEAVANHGDSLSHLKPDEYLNLMIVEDSGHRWAMGHTGHESRPVVLSVRRSDISAYRTGSIDMAEFGSRVMEY